MLTYRIAGHMIQFESEHEPLLHRMLANYHPFGAEAAPEEVPLLRISFDAEPVLPLREPCDSYPYDLAEDKALLRTYTDRYVLEIACTDTGRRFGMECPAPGLFDRTSETETYAGTEPGCPPDFCRLLTDRPHYIFRTGLAADDAHAPRNVIDHMAVFAFSLAALARQTLLVHASTVICGGKAVMFLGESGTGKSTHSRLWLENIPGTELLNDDAPAVRTVSGRPVAYGTPWSGKTPCYRPVCYPVAAIIRLKQAPYNRIERLSGISAFGALLPSCLPTLQRRDASLDLICGTLSEILLTTPVYRLECLPDAEAAKLAYGTVMQAIL